MQTLINDAHAIIKRTIEANMMETSIRDVLRKHKFSDEGDVYIVAIGKASWTMANAAYCSIGTHIKQGIVITKYGHSKGAIPHMKIFEAGHPIPDENSLAATQEVIDMVKALRATDEVIFLVSGGGSALFEKPLDGITLEDIISINDQLLKCGADIVEINMVRKRLSAVKAGRFAQICYPVKVFSVILSDVLGDKLDSIASGPAVPDMTISFDVMNVIKKYNISINPVIKKLISDETPKTLENVETVILGSVRSLCESAAECAEGFGYTPLILTTELRCEAREAGSFIASIARQVGKDKYSLKKPSAIIFGGETVVRVKGTGKGGRNQEIALAAAEGIDGLENIVIFSLGSDGTDGPTDAAGGIVDGSSARRLRDKKIKISAALADNDSYNALKKINALITTGPTGINLNDISVILSVRGRDEI
ncbi:MAG: glycerate kinase [Elusimicrobiota bacterium]|jgi:hydroxypyruvate reductase|nr:glycerate kinase [Elusimicrobiota bacterium]